MFLFAGTQTEMSTESIVCPVPKPTFNGPVLIRVEESKKTGKLLRKYMQHRYFYTQKIMEITNFYRLIGWLTNTFSKWKYEFYIHFGLS
jgi:hypothetical protein